jgi:hypothetical protein
MMLGRSNNRCLIRKKEKTKEKVIKNRSQHKIIHRGAKLFLK